MAELKESSSLMAQFFELWKEMEIWCFI